jgi:UTP-glucose-1-phosphate uridylyltransferase
MKSLVILAAGMGSRYGGLKQFDPVGPSGEFLLDYSIYDAQRAGFSEVFFVIRPEMEETFAEEVIKRYLDSLEGITVDYLFQKQDDLMSSAGLFQDEEAQAHFLSLRQKPWGTGHALLAARKRINHPFAMINADDYYGPEGYQLLAHFLESAPPHAAAMVPYQLKKTLSAHGKVSRGICQEDSQHYLLKIEEMTELGFFEEENKVVGKRSDGKKVSLTGEEPVSLNLWGFTPDFLELLEEEWRHFLQKLVAEPDTWADQPEFYLPSAIDHLMKEKRLAVKLLPSKDRWFGLTHPQDRQMVMKALEEMVDRGVSPCSLLDR